MLRGFAIVCVAVCALRVFAGEVPVAPEPGAAIPTFTLSDIYRRPRSLDSYKNKQAMKATVLFFIGTECPLANRCLPLLIALHQEYSEKGVQFLAINSNIQDSFVEVSAHAQERDIPFPVLKDFDHAVADACGAKRTPEVFLLDADRVIRYHGRLDDQNEVGFQRDKPSWHDLRE